VAKDHADAEAAGSFVFRYCGLPERVRRRGRADGGNRVLVTLKRDQQAIEERRIDSGRLAARTAGSIRPCAR